MIDNTQIITLCKEGGREGGLKWALWTTVTTLSFPEVEPQRGSGQGAQALMPVSQGHSGCMCETGAGRHQRDYMTLQMGDSGGQDRGGAGMREGGSGNIPKVQLPRSADVDGRGIEDDLQGCGQGS